MPKINPNDKCHCNSDKKYKKCCMLKDMNSKHDEELIYLNGNDNSSAKIKICMEHYNRLFDKHKIIDITDSINIDNYRTFQIKNYLNKTIMLGERTENNNDFFIEKANNEKCDIIFMYKGVFRVMNFMNIAKFDEDIINIITKRDSGQNIN